MRWVRWASEHSLGLGMNLHSDNAFSVNNPSHYLFQDGYLKVSSNGYQDVDHPYSDRYISYRKDIADSVSTMSIVSNVNNTAGNSKISVSFSEVESAIYYNIYYSTDFKHAY